MRRGQTQMMVEYLPRALLMLIAMTVIVLLVHAYTDRTTDSPHTARGVYIYRLVYSDALMLQDKTTGRVTVGVVDLDKLTSTTLDEIFSSDDLRASMVTITPLGGCPLNGKTIYGNKKEYEQYAPFGSTVSGSTREDRIFPVTIRSGDTSCPGTLNISVVRLDQ